MPDFFIIGSARSGTTLLRVLLTSHPDIVVPPESYFVLPVLSRADSLSVPDAWRHIASSASFAEWELPHEHVWRRWDQQPPSTAREVLDVAYAAYKDAHAARLVGDKTPYHISALPLLARHYPDASFLLLEREGIDVVRSVGETHFGSRFLGANALTWGREVAQSREFFAAERVRWLRTSYRELTEQTPATMRAISQFLGVPFDDRTTRTGEHTAAMVSGLRTSTHLRRVGEPVAANRRGPPSPWQTWRFEAVTMPLLGDGAPRSRAQRVYAGWVRVGTASRRVARRPAAIARRRMGRRLVDRFPPTESVTPAGGLGSGVAALVLTCAAPGPLGRCLTAVQQQSFPVREVVVRQNCATDPVSVPAGLRVSEMPRGHNNGPAGGWADLIEHAMRSTSAEWFWLLDDDCRPTPDALAALLKRGGRHGRGVILPTIREPSGTLRRYPAWIGVLIHRRTVEMMGLPRRELVWWGEDAEYLQIRPPLCGFVPTYANDAIVDHEPARRRGPAPPWKIYYEARNTVWIRLWARQQYARPAKMARVARVFAQQVARVPTSGRPALSAYLLSRAAWDGRHPRRLREPAVMAGLGPHAVPTPPRRSGSRSSRRRR